MSAIVIEGLGKIYGSVTALDRLDLHVEQGVVFGFLGPNGAGKTTTMRILAGLAHPSSGRAWIEGLPVGPGSHARRLIGYLPEEPSFYPWMRVDEFLADLVGRIYGMSRSEAKARADEMKALVGLEKVTKRRIGGFSRGMRQRLGLAQAFMNRPQVLLLDEPVSGLDPVGRRDILDLIDQLRGEATVFMSTHILDDVERICDTVGILNHGRLIALDEKENLLCRYATPVIEVKFNATPEAVAHWVESVHELAFVASIQLDGSVVRITLDGSAQSSTELQQLVLQSGLLVLSYQHKHPQLEDVFMKLVG